MKNKISVILSAIRGECSSDEVERCRSTRKLVVFDCVLPQ